MNRKLSVAVILIGLLSIAGLVSADYIQIKQFYINDTFSNGRGLTLDFSDAPYQYRGSLYVYVDGDGSFTASDVDAHYSVIFTFDNDVIEVRGYQTSSGDLNTKILLNGVVIDDGGMPFDKVWLEPVNNTAVRIIAENTAYPLVTRNVTLNISSTTLMKIDIETTNYASLKVNNIYIKRWSDSLSSLSVLDENTGGGLSSYDFTESSGYIKVFDLAGTYIGRTYYISGTGNSLTAYLVKYYEGHWYTIFAGPNYINQTLQVLRSIDGSWVIIGETTFDTTGTASMFLADGATYLFRIIDKSNNVLFSAQRTTNPSEPTINLAGGLESVIVTTDVTASLSWAIGPSDGFLYVNRSNTVSVQFQSETTVTNVTLSLVGAGVSLSETRVFNSPGGAFLVNVTPIEANSYVFATLEIKFSDGSVKTYHRSFFVRQYIEPSNQSLLNALKETPDELGLGTVGRAFVAMMISLAAVAVVAGAFGTGAGVVVGASVWIIFTWAGWIDWRITMISILAGVGMLIRRGEA